MYILDVVHKIGSQFQKCRNSVAHLTQKIEKTYLKLNVSDELLNKSQNLLDWEQLGQRILGVMKSINWDRVIPSIKIRYCESRDNTLHFKYRESMIILQCNIERMLSLAKWPWYIHSQDDFFFFYQFSN